MSEARAVTVHQPITPDSWRMVEQIAAVAHASRALGVTSSQEASMKMLAGVERGLPLSTSLQCIYLVKGRPGIQPKALWGLILGHPDFDASGYVEERLERGNQFLGYAITLRRKNGFSARRQFTIDDAIRAQLANKDNWRGYPEHCCYWRAMAAVQDVVFGDVCMGLYRADELGMEITPEGNVIEGQWAPAAAAAPVLTLDTLLAEGYTPDQILRAAGGNMPCDQQAIVEVATVLRARARAGIEQPGDVDPNDPMGVQAMAAANDSQRGEQAE